VRDTNEPQGFGLYSYLLLTPTSSDSVRQRYLAVISAYRNQLIPIDKLAAFVDSKQLNITFVPVMKAPPAAPSAEWILDHYDYERADQLLQPLSQKHFSEGPYLVSVLNPLTQDPHPDRSQMLFQDLSHVPVQPADLIGWWIREFMEQAAQQRFWDAKTADMLALNLRTAISVLASGLPDVQKGIASWITWSQK
jgi:hypothetical protein